MNIFVLDTDPVLAAQMQCDKHVVKMIVETAQLLSTAHRLADGLCVTDTVVSPKTGKLRHKKSWKLEDQVMQNTLYGATHTGHPCLLWTMESVSNYIWLYEHFCALCDEYTYRYNRIHKTDSLLRDLLSDAPVNTPERGLTPFRKAMKSQPACEAIADPVQAYRAFYLTKASRFSLKWTNRQPPEWMGWVQHT